MKIRLYSIFVDDQDKAVDFYTRVLGFEKRQDIPVGKYRWISFVSPEDGRNATELSLEPNANPIAKTYQEALFKAGIPITAFETDDIQAEFARLKSLQVEFTVPPTNAGMVWIAIFSDTCGNLIQIYQRTATGA